MYFLITILIVIINSSQLNGHESRDFCESYAENDYKIDSTFQRIFESENEGSAQLLLIIGHNYWVIKVNELALHLNTSSSYSNWFDRQYTGFVVNFTDQYAYGLLNSKEFTIDWRIYNSSETDFNDHQAEINKTSVELGTDFNAIASIRTFRPNTTCFASQTPVGNGYRLKYRCIEFKSINDTIMDAENQLILEYPAHLQKYHNNKYTLYELRENHTFEMDSQHEVLAMFGKFTFDDRYVILYREGPNMMYCWTDRQLPDNYWTDCFNSGKYTLINCPPVSNMFAMFHWILIGVVFAGVIVGAMLGTCMALTCRKKSSDRNATYLSTSGQWIISEGKDIDLDIKAGAAPTTTTTTGCGICGDSRTGKDTGAGKDTDPGKGTGTPGGTGDNDSKDTGIDEKTNGGTGTGGDTGNDGGTSGGICGGHFSEGA